MYLSCSSDVNSATGPLSSMTGVPVRLAARDEDGDPCYSGLQFSWDDTSSQATQSYKQYFNLTREGEVRVAANLSSLQPDPDTDTEDNIKNMGSFNYNIINICFALILFFLRYWATTDVQKTSFSENQMKYCFEQFTYCG